MQGKARTHRGLRQAGQRVAAGWAGGGGSGAAAHAVKCLCRVVWRAERKKTCSSRVSLFSTSSFDPVCRMEPFALFLLNLLGLVVIGDLLRVQVQVEDLQTLGRGWPVSRAAATIPPGRLFFPVLAVISSFLWAHLKVNSIRAAKDMTRCHGLEIWHAS